MKINEIQIQPEEPVPPAEYPNHSDIPETERLIIKDIQVAGTSFAPNELIQDNIPKIVFIGRSNVGKSSLINKLMNRKRVARVSSKPGKTVSINYFLINQAFYFVDLPGYGYAKISKQESLRVKKLITAFFQTVKNLKLVLILIDSRRGFMESDLEILGQIINNGFRLLTVLTKSDKLRNSEIVNQKSILQNNYDLKVISFSIKKEGNSQEILKYINQSITE